MRAPFDKGGGEGRCTGDSSHSGRFCELGFVDELSFFGKPGFVGVLGFLGKPGFVGVLGFFGKPDAVLADGDETLAVEMSDGTLEGCLA